MVDTETMLLGRLHLTAIYGRFWREESQDFWKWREIDTGYQDYFFADPVWILYFIKRGGGGVGGSWCSIVGLLDLFDVHL